MGSSILGRLRNILKFFARDVAQRLAITIT
jgi:hypothetical protein